MRGADQLVIDENPCGRILCLISWLVMLAITIIPSTNSLILCMPVLLFPILCSRIFRAHLAAVHCCRPRDSLDYTFHWSIRKPPFRRKPDPPRSELPACFLPTE